MFQHTIHSSTHELYLITELLVIVHQGLSHLVLCEPDFDLKWLIEKNELNKPTGAKNQGNKQNKTKNNFNGFLLERGSCGQVMTLTQEYQMHLTFCQEYI